MMGEIGGYFGLESRGDAFLHDEGICLNSGCSALRYLIRAEGILRLHVPRYTCGSVHAAVRKENCEIIPYDIGADWMPTEVFPDDDYILFNNYFGVSGKRVRQMAKRYRRLIVDAAQAFYASSQGFATFYSPRKFFGVPDGGILCGYKSTDCVPEQGVSWNKAVHLLKRVDVSGAFGYEDFRENERKIADEPILKMSRLTRVLMGNIDCDLAAKRRLANFNYLRQQLPSSFPYALAEDDVPMVYPYITADPELRARLISDKIFVASYWPGVINTGLLKEHILPLPIDQRYNEEDMMRIVKAVKS